MKQIRLSKGLFALVSDADFDWLMQWSWYASHESRGTKWYAIRREGKKKIRMHRAILERPTALVYCGESVRYEVPPGMVVDHINHNSLDNRRENLQVITQRENMLLSPGWKRKTTKTHPPQNPERQTSAASDQLPRNT